MEKFIRFANALFILVLMGILTAAYYQQFFKHERPCPLCILQRLGMFGVSLGLFLNLRQRIRTIHYGFSLLFAIFGAFVSLRQISLHVCPGFPIFGIPVFGLELYTWAFMAFALSIISIALLLLLKPKEVVIIKMNWFEWVASTVLLLLLLSNFYTTYLECTFGPCIDLPWPQPTSAP